MPGSRPFRRGLRAFAACWIAGLAWVGSCLAALPAPPQELKEALRARAGEAPRAVTLPDQADTDPLAPSAAAETTYRLSVDLGPVPWRTAVYLPGIFAHVRVAVNGHTVADRIRTPLPEPPRGADRLLFATVPSEFVRAGSNELAITLAGRRGSSLSRVWVGDEDTLRRLHERKTLLLVEGPIVAAAVIVALSLCVLILWARRSGESLYGYFGIGGLLWALHTVWTVLPDPILAPPHLGIWWTMGYPFFCVPLVIFCVRLAQWHLPRFERTLWIGIAIGPPLLYAGHFAGVQDAVQDYWRLAWIGAVGVGVFAVGRYAFQQRNTQGVLLLATGATALTFAVRDWLLDQDLSDNNPVFLTSFSGLLFFPLVAWILIDGFLRTARELEQLNLELERRVALKGRELQDALDDMRHARDAAETANRAKSSFLAAASHDLRQPAHALGLYMAALRSGPLNVDQSTLVDSMSASVGALDTMFNSLLDISRMDAGAVAADIRPFELEAVLFRVAGEFAREAAHKGLRLSVRVSAAARRLRGRSDPVLFERIVRNLVGNAVKYTHQGGVLLTCRLAGGDKPCWDIEVRDTGPGIAATEQERVFEEFFQIDDPAHEQAGGLGLGLAIVRSLSQLMDHPLRLDSVPGRGSRFRLVIPATSDPAHVEIGSTPTGSLKGLGVGVVEDDQKVRDAMRVLLERWGCRVFVGATVDELLGNVSAGGAHAPVQALVVDYQLRGGLNGIQVIDAVGRALGGRLPALIVSGASSAERLAELQASGFEWLAKPLSPARLRSWLIQSAREVAAVD